MDRTLLERMIGAVVLVLVLVLLAPALLDGSADSNRDGELSPSDDPGKRTEVIILNAPVNAQPPAQISSSSASASNSSPVAKVNPRPVAEPAKSSARPAPLKATETRPAAGSPTVLQGFAVQLGSFSERGNAARYATRLEADGFAAFVQRGSAASGSVYRVYSGPANTRESAGELAAKLKSAGHSVMVVELGNGSGG